MPLPKPVSDIQVRPEDSQHLSRPRSSRKRRRTHLQPFGPLRYRWYLPIKALLDKVLAVALLFATAPLMLLAALLVKLTSRGPAFYTQTRVGQYGRHFTIWKLRTMVDKCESLTGPRWAIPGDPRITWIGQVLRKTHVDELPQLLNVLCGDMSLVGPRPERPEFIPKLERQLPGYRNRLVVRPGLTGLAQLQLDADTDIDSVRRKLSHDRYYIQWLSPWLDCRILFCTALYALKIPFRIAGRLTGVPHSDTIEQAAAAEKAERLAA